MQLAVLVWICFVVPGLAQVVKPPPLQISCLDPPDRVYTRQDKDVRFTCLWKAETDLGYSPSATENESGDPPTCAWHNNGAKLLDTVMWSGRVKIAASVGDTVTVQCMTPTCAVPACVHQKTTIVVDRQDAKLFFTPASPVQQYEVVQFGWCAKMKSAAWKYRFSSRQTEVGIVIPSNYHSEIEDSAYPAGVRDYCSTYYRYKVQVSYTKPGTYVASLTVQNGPVPELSVSLEVEQTVLHVLSATSNQLPHITNLKLSWNLLQLINKAAFQLTDRKGVATWDVTFNKYAIKEDFCSLPLSTAGYGFARIQFLINASKIIPLSGEIDYTKGIVGMTTTKHLGSVTLNPKDAKSNTYYFSQLSGLYYFSTEDKVDAGCSVHFIFYQQESLSYLFQFRLVEMQKYSLTAHVYLNTKSALYKSLKDVGVNVHFLNSGSSLLYTFIYIVWFIPIQHPLLQCEWTFILELYGSKKRYLFKNTTYTYKDSVSNAATFIPGTILPFNSKLYAGFVAKVNFTKSGLKPVVLKTNVGTYAREVLETSIYCYKVFCEIIAFQIKKPKYPSAIVTIKGMHLSIFVSIQINCSASQGVSMLWRVYRVSSASDIPVWDNYLTLPQVSPINQSSIEIPRLALNYGFYVFNVSINITTVDDEDSSRSNTDSVVVEVRESDLIAVISGGSFRTVGFSEKWTLDGRFSYDPDSQDPLRGLSFAWYCSKLASDYQLMILTTKTNCHPNQISLSWVNPNSVTHSVEPETLQGNRHYYFRLVASKGNKTGYVDQTVFIAPGSPPGVSITCIENCFRILVPTERFSLSGKCTDCSTTSRPVYEWSLFQSSTEVNLDWTSKTTTGKSSAYISFIALTFIDLAKMWYTLVLKLTTWTGAPSLYKYRFYVNSPPKAGNCLIKPPIGITLQTKFIISCSGFSDDNLPLRYKVLVALDKVSHISSLQENPLGAIIYDGYNTTTPPLLLPVGAPGESYVLKVYILVYDSLSSYTQIARSVTVKNLHGQPNKLYLTELISQAHSPLMNFFLDTGDYIKSGHFIYMIASNLNSFMTNTFLYPLKDEKSTLRESLLNMSSNVMITNIMTVNQIIFSISELTKDTKELNTKSQQLAVAKLAEVGVALTKYRKETIGSVESERLSSGILASLSNVMEASLINIAVIPVIPFHTVEVLQNTLSVMETVTDVISFGKVPGETDTFMVTNNVRISLKKEEKWDLTGSYRKRKDCLTCFYPTLHDNEAVLPVDAIVTAAFYEFKEDPLPWLENGRDIDTVVTGFYMAATSNKGGLINVIPRRLDVIMERKKVIPIFDVSVSPDTEKTTSGTFCFQVNLKLKAEWFVHFFYTKKITFNISLHIGDNITNNPLAFFQIPKVEKVQIKSSEIPGLQTWNSKMISIPIESIPKTSLVHNLTIEMTTNYVVWKKTKLLRASIFNIACLDFQEVGDNWNDGNCKVGPLSNNKVIHCICEGFTKAQRRSVPFLKKRHKFISARVLVVPNPIDLTKANVRALQSNLVTLITVIVIFVIYIGLAMWARKKDKYDMTSKQTVIILPDNDPYDTQCLLVTIYTGSRFGSGTTADVYLKIVGTDCDSQVHLLKCPGHHVFVRGGLDTFLVTTRFSLGDIRNIRIWHNNAGASPGWFLSRIRVENMCTKQVWYFVCQKWLDLEKKDCSINSTFVPLKRDEPVQKCQYFHIKLSCKLCEEHLWFSVFATALPEVFNRFRRLSCCLVILISSLLVNIIFFNAAESADDEPEIQFLRSVMVGFESSLITVPIQFVVLSLFRFSQDKPFSWPHTFAKDKLHYDTFDKSSNVKAKDSVERLEIFYEIQDSKDTTMEIHSACSRLDSLRSSLVTFATRKRISHRHRNNCVISDASASKIVKAEHTVMFAKTIPEEDGQNFLQKKFVIRKKLQVNYRKHMKQISSFVPPWWCIYVAWSFVFIISTVSAVLIIMYGLSYGFKLSMTWLMACVISFFQSIFVIDIVKIVFLTSFASFSPKFYQDIPWTTRCFSEVNLYEFSKNSDEAENLHCKLAALRNTKQYQPPHDDEITIIRKMNLIKRKAFIFFRGFVNHFIFLTLLLHFAYSTDKNTFYYNQELYKRFSYNLGSVDRIDHIYNWTSEVFLPLIHNHKQPGFIADSWSKIVGLPRIRQVKGTHCPRRSSTVYALLSDAISCMKKYANGENIRTTTVNKHFNPREYIGYIYERSVPHWNYTLFGAKFGSEGYTVYFFPEKNIAQSLNRILELQNTNWLDEEMGAVVIELTTFNPDANLFCSISIIFEASDLGRLNKELSVHSFTMYTFQDLDHFHIFLNLTFIALMIIYIAGEIHTIVQLKKNYISIANGANLFLKCLLFLSFVFYLAKFILAPALLHLYSLYPNQFIPFYIVSIVDQMFRNTLGFLTYFTVLKSLQYTKYIYEVRLAEKALMAALSSICAMALVVSICFIAYATVGYLVFGQYEWRYRTFLNAAQTVLSYSISSFKESFYENSSLLSGLYFSSFLFVMTCLIINLFQAIILSTYEEMRNPVFQEASDETEIIAFLAYKIKLFWAYLIRKHSEKREREIFSSTLYGRPQPKMENTVGLKRRKMNRKELPRLHF